ncbi:hypothetical protein B0H17DRAFT_1144793 [Mycena rosella]|uniref:Uncharacterized protein n=1 Tax=Mycena rosella TaxID=1033263 RepID=A0AAD7CRY6_MYCRO|nr:hypothetical protein B0H17DRAFT_1144793 [Mycena rosella]
MNLDSTLGLEPIVPAYAAPLPKEDALRALEVVLADERRRSSTWFTDDSLLDGSVGGAAVRVKDGVERERICMPLGDGQVCEGEMEGLVQGGTGPAKINQSRNYKCVSLLSHLLHTSIMNVPANAHINQSGTVPAARRSSRKHKKLEDLPDLSENLVQCLCGQSAVPVDSAASTNVAQFRIESCEIKWYHLASIRQGSVPDNWACEACISTGIGRAKCVRRARR